ncbi:Microtubule associated protein [Nesidiocoris tenuis]|uniref:Microtubule associated protein n=1 Tax=Nesidiocoris tenuis TaxID=355587 RepID=A0ABN7AHQ9_9HEMI|nr:Microtubule associated protein [Nesidiocoris tenuis]
MEDDNYDGIPLEKLLCHNNWKARIEGYKKAGSLFRAIDHENVEEWSKYVNFVKRFCSDNNAPALEKGLETAIEFVDRSCLAKKTAHTVLPVIVEKCMAPQRPRAKELGTKLILLFVELGKGRIVFDELLKGTTMKNPKISSNCIGVIREIIRAFGAQVFESAQILERALPLLDDRNQCVRNEAKSLVVEFYRWTGPELMAKLQNTLKPVLFNEISAIFAGISNSPVKPVRVFRSPNLANNFNLETVPQSETDDAKNRSAEKLPDDLPTVDVFGKIPEDFYNGLQSKKWSDRKDALESLLEILNSAPRIQNGDFSDLVRSLSGVISKDPNIGVVCTAVKCITKLVEGLGNKFTIYASTVVKILFSKFKEKKQTVVSAVHDAIDAILKISCFENILEVVMENLAHKNPNAKYETVVFLSRHLPSTSANFFENRKLSKNLLSNLAALLTDQDPNVRDVTIKALASVLKKLGESKFKNLCPSVDDQKLAKLIDYNVRHFAAEDKAVVTQEVRPQTSWSSEVIRPCPPRSASKMPPKLVPENFSRKNHDKSPKIRNVACPELPEDVIKRLAAKNWTEKQRAIFDLQRFLLSNESRILNFKESAELIVHLISDTNLRVASAAISLIEELAQNRSYVIKNQLHQFIPPILAYIGHPKIRVSQPAETCINALIVTFGFEIFLKNDTVLVILQSGSLGARIRLWQWLTDKLSSVNPSENLRPWLANFLPTLFTNLTDRNQDLRRAANQAVVGFAQVIGSQFILSASENHSKDVHDAVEKMLEQLEKNGDLATKKETRQLSPSNVENQTSQNPNPKSEDKNSEVTNEISREKNIAKFKLDQSLIEIVDQAMNAPIIRPKITKIDIAFINERTIPLPTMGNLSKTNMLQTSNVNFILSYANALNQKDSEVALEKIGAIISSEDSNFIQESQINVFLNSLVEKVKIFAKSQLPASNEADNLFSVISTLSLSRTWMERFPENELLQLLKNLIVLLSYEDGGEGEFFDRKTVNSIVLGILANANKTTLLRCIFKLMVDAFDDLPIFNLLIKCLWKLQRSEAFWDKEIDYPRVLNAIGGFLDHFGTSWWDSNDRAALTVKRMLHSIVKARGAGVLTHLNLQIGTSESGIPAYMRKSSNLTSEDGSRLSSSECFELSTIFAEIAENPITGFRLLKAFNLKKGRFDLTALLSEMSPILSKYALFSDFREGMICCDSRRRASEISTAESFLGEAARLRWRLEILKQQFMA